MRLRHEVDIILKLAGLWHFLLFYLLSQHTIASEMPIMSSAFSTKSHISLSLQSDYKFLALCHHLLCRVRRYRMAVTL